MLKLYLLGPPRVEFDDRPVDIQRRKALALLIYLSVSHQPHSRDTLATLFYPEQDQKRARAYLRRDLASLNTSLPGEWLAADREVVEFKCGNDVWLDVEQFHHHLTACQAHTHPTDEVCDDCLPLLAEAVDLYQADFLEGFTLQDAPEFDEWQYFEAEGLRQELGSVLVKLGEGHSVRGDYEAAIPYVRRWLALDPLHEPAQQVLMQLYHQAGQPSAALRQYELYIEHLDEELGVPPGEETATLYEAIKANRMGAYLKRVATPDSKGDESTATARAASHRSNLPVQPTPFVGREEEVTEISQLLLDEPGCRLLTLVGPGGIGKTRLALEAAFQAGQVFNDGAYFVPLAPVGTVESIVPAIAEALKFNFQGETDPQKQLLHHLGQKNYLLILDNFEHLLSSPAEINGGEGLLADILQAAPHLKVLVTSRERLNLQEEWGYDVPGMPFPQDTITIEADPQALEQYAAVQLFLQRARKAKAGFVCSGPEMIAVIHICRLVGGMPLGIELAAPWVRVMSCQEIANEIEQSFDLLATSLRNVPERHRSMRAILEQTWQQLPSEEQAILSKLSVFRGGCLREAAEVVAGATLLLLSSLVDKALLRRVDEGRYELHELIRQFAQEQLQSTPEAKTTWQSHSTYYLDLLRQRETDIVGKRQIDTLNEIQADLENILAAWYWAVAEGEVEAIAISLETLFQFYWIRSRFQEGESAFGLAVARLPDLRRKSQPIFENIYLRLTNRQGAFRYALGLTEQTDEELQHGVQMARALKDKKELAFSLNFLGEVTRTQGDYEAAIQLFEEGLALGREIDDPLRIAHSLKGLGWAAGEEGSDYAKGKAYYQEALSHYRAVEHLAEIAFCLDKLGHMAWKLGDYEEAEQRHRESLKRFQAIGDQLGMSNTLGGLALAYYSLGGDRLPEARSYAEEGLAICRETGRQLELTNRLIILGLVLFRLGEIEQAEVFYREAQEIAGSINYKGGIILACNGFGAVATERKAFNQARNFFLEALSRAVQIHSFQHITLILTDYATLLIKDTTTPSDAATAKQTTACVILNQVINRRSTWHDTKTQAAHLLAALEDKLLSESLAMAQTRSRNTTLEQTAAEILQRNLNNHPVLVT